MAKEKSDKVRKGFFFYFGFFLLIIVAVVLIIFVVMMFMPGTSILGLEYFAGEGAQRIMATTDTKSEISFEQPNFSSVEINCGYADVLVQKNNDYQLDGIYIVNNARGFVTTAKANDFAYSVALENDVLKISVTEQNGFLYFSKDVKIVLQISNENLNPFSDKSITIKNSDGNIYIGGHVKTGYSHDIDVSNLNVNSLNGDILLSAHSPNSYANLNLQTGSGEISISKTDVSADNMTLQTGSGNITAGSLSSPNVITLNSNKGKITINQISGFSSQCTDAYMNIGTVNGNADFTASAESFGSSVININQINGNITADDAHNSTFNLGTVAGTAFVHTSTGAINITGSIQSYSNLYTKSGNITATIAQNASNVSVTTEKGNIQVTLPRDFVALTIENQTGETNLNVFKDVNCSISFNYYGEEQTQEFAFNNVNLNLPDVTPTNPMVLGSGESDLTLRCNKTINFNWLESA